MIGRLWRANRLRLAGLAFVAVLLAAVGLSVAVYRKAFTPMVRVTLRTDHAGLQLDTGADVKIRGVIVGEVTGVSTEGSGATLRLALDPASARLIPANATARLLPKTLFGEEYVALAPPTGPPARPVRDGDVIAQDRSAAAIELEKVLDDTYALLITIAPDKLAATLGALAGALVGRGDELGRTLTALDGYLRQINPGMPDMRADLVKLADTLSVYGDIAPQLLAILRDTAVTMTTVSSQRDQLAAFLADATGAAGTATGFLDRYGDRIIQIGQISQPLLDLLAAYAPEYPCLLAGAVAQQPAVEQVFAGGRMHITLEATRDNGKYLRGVDTPRYGARNGPNCRGLPDPAVPAPEVPVNDGYDYGARPAAPPGGAAVTSAAYQPADMGYAGTAQERAVVDALVGPATGVPPDRVPPAADLLWGPLLRGTVVNES